MTSSPDEILIFLVTGKENRLEAETREKVWTTTKGHYSRRIGARARVFRYFSSSPDISKYDEVKFGTRSDRCYALLIIVVIRGCEIAELKICGGRASPDLPCLSCITTEGLHSPSRYIASSTQIAHS